MRIWDHNRLRSLIWLSLLAAFLEVAPVSAQPPLRLPAEPAIERGNRWTTALCVELRPSKRATGAKLLGARSLPALLAYAGELGGTRCTISQPNRQMRAAAQAPAPHQAGLVIDFGAGLVMTYCIELGANGQIAGIDLLRASNLPVVIEVTGGVGGAVCKIGDVGSNFPAEPCFASCTLRPGEPCIYWSYSQLIGDHWQYAQLGPSNTVVHAGDVDGWAWGAGTVAQGAQPPLRTLTAICAPANASPTGTATRSPTLTAAPSLTPTAADTPTAPPPTPIGSSATPAPSATSAPRRRPAPPTATALSPTAAPSMPPAVTFTATLPRPTAALPAAAPATPTPAPPVVTATLMVVAQAPLDQAPLAPEARSAVQLWLPVLQRAIPTPSATRLPPLPTAAGPAASAPNRAAPTRAAATIATAPTSAPIQAAAANRPTRNYPIFGGMVVFLLACWAAVRRGRGRGVQ